MRRTEKGSLRGACPSVGPRCPGCSSCSRCSWWPCRCRSPTRRRTPSTSTADFGVGGYCDGSGVNRPESVVPGWSVTYRVKGDTIEATIKVKHYFDSVFLARIVQGPHDCKAADWVVFTLPKGQDTIRL